MLGYMTSNPPPGWYPDPAGSDAERFWDGVAWSQATRDKAWPQPAAALDVPASPQGHRGYGLPGHGANLAPGPQLPRLANFGWRLFGYILDGLTVWILAAIICWVNGLFARMRLLFGEWFREVRIAAESNQSTVPELPEQLVQTMQTIALITVVVAVVYRIMLYLIWSATLGQRVLGLRTVKLGQGPDGRLTPGVAVLRAIAAEALYLLWLTALINGLCCAFTQRRQTLADMIARTQVLKIR